MKKTFLLIFAILLAIAVKAQDFKSFYTIENDGSIELDITNYDFHERFYIIYNIFRDKSFEISEGKTYGLFKIKTAQDFDAYLAKSHKEYGELSKYDLDDYVEFSKEILPKMFVTSMLFDLVTEYPDGTTLNDHCANSEPFCTSEVIQFLAPANSSQEPIPSAGCLSTRPCPAWFHMRINTPGQFIIHMEGVDPNSGTQRDIDFCLWGPFEHPTTPCTSELTGSKIIDCSYSGNNTEDAFLGYQAGQHSHHGSSHGNINYHLPEHGEYYILLITNYSQQNCRISFTKQANSGPGTTDCSIVDPFLTANTPCVGETLHLAADEVQDAVSYTWHAPDGTTTHNGREWNRTNTTIAMAGLYTCHVVTNTSSGDESINVVILPNVNADFSFPAECIAGQPIQFTDHATMNPASGHNYQINERAWNFGDPSSGASNTSNATNPTHTFNTPGTYHVTYTAAVTGGNEGECVDSKTKNVVVRSSMSTNITGNTEICQNDTIKLDAHASGGSGNFTYVWTKNDIIVGHEANLRLRLTEAGTFSFMCEISDGTTTQSPNVNVTVKALPTANAGEDQTINFDNSTELEAEYVSGNDVTYSWQPADSLANPHQNNQRKVRTKALKGNTLFTLTVTKNGCVNTDDVVVSVGAEMTATATIDDSEICQYESTTVTARAVGGNPNDYSFSWEPANEVEYPHAASSTVYPSVNTDHFTCTISDGHTTLVKTVNITVHELPIAYAGEDDFVYYNTSAVLTAETVHGNNVKYEWFPKEKIINGDNEHQSVTTVPLTEETEFTLRVTRNGCSTEDNVTIFAGNQLQGKVEAQDNSICQFDGYSVLTVTAFGGNDNKSYHWESSKPGQFSSTNAFITTFSNPTETGEYVIKCTIFDGETTIERTTSINVTAQPVAQISIQNPNIINEIPSVVVGRSVVLEAAYVENAIYEWEPNNLIMDLAENGRIATTYPLNDIGLKEFNLTVKTETQTHNYCANTTSATVKVYDNIFSSFTSSHDSICEKERLTLTAQATGGTGDYKFTWEPAQYFDNNIGQTVTTKALPGHVGLINFTCNVEDNQLYYANSSKNMDIYINDAPTVNYDLVGVKLVEAGNEFYPFVYEYSIDETSLSGYKINSISWNLISEQHTPNQIDSVTMESMWFCIPEPDPAIPGQPKKAYVYTNEEGNARLTCTITGECGYTTARIIIYTAGYDYDDVSVEEINYDDLIIVYPNPTNGELYVDYGDINTSTVSVGIYNYSGLKMMQFTDDATSRIGHYSMSGLANGMYIVRITGKDFVVTKKIVLLK